MGGGVRPKAEKKIVSVGAISTFRHPLALQCDVWSLDTLLDTATQIIPKKKNAKSRAFQPMYWARVCQDSKAAPRVDFYFSATRGQPTYHIIRHTVYIW